MRKSPTVNDKTCSVCGIIYTPCGTVQKMCKPCSKIKDIERKKKWHESHRTLKPVIDHGDCVVCGKAFYSSHLGVDLCQQHYNISYRTGSPYTDTSIKNTNTFIEMADCYLGKTASGVEYYFDKADYDLVSKHSWCVSKTGYLVANIKGKVIKQHRLIIEPPAHLVIDHIDGNAFNNRRTNLRITTNQKNCRNSKSNCSSTGVLGVSITKSGKFMARISINRKEIKLGVYDTLELAKRAREFGEIKYFGQYAPSLSRKSQ